MQYSFFKKLFYILTIGAIVFSATLAPVFAAPGVPNIVSYQGRLTDDSGNLLGGSGTDYYFRFSFWTTPAIGGGSKLWPSGQPGTVTSTVVDGVFNINIGDTINGYPDALTYNFQDSDAIYLQIEVSSDGVSFETLGPRQRIVSSGYAINAQTLGGLSAGTGANNVLTLGVDGEIVLSSTGTSTLGNVSLNTVSAGTWQGTAIADGYITKTGNWSGIFDGNEGSYYLDANNLTNFSIPFATVFATMDTDDLAEGLNNLYYSDTRARAALSAGAGIGYNSITGVISNTGVTTFNTRTGAVTLSSLDMTTALGYTPINPNGTLLQYFRGDGSLSLFPTALSSFTNDSGYVTGGGTASGTNTGDITLGAIGAAPNANGASLSGQVLTLEPADASFGGIMTTGTQSITGAKTFTTSINTNKLILPVTIAASLNGVIYKDANSFIHDFNYGNNGTVTTTGENTFVGTQAGNLTMGATATQTNHASFNTGIGYQALTANTLGNSNTAIGNTALVANTAGHSNTAIGAYTMVTNTTGYQNTAVGSSALNRNTTGINNVAIGPSALYYNTTGHHNTAVGFVAGYLIASGNSNSTSNHSVYLGYLTKAGDNGNTNEIVIGANAVGNGSNTATIGNTSLLRTYLTGVNLKAGTTAAGTAPLKFTSGALLTASEAGAVEFLGDVFYGTVTTGAERKQFAFLSDITGINSGTNTGDITLGAIGAAPNANGASLSGQVLTLEPADASFGGIMTTGTQSIAGAKTFMTSLSTPILIGGTSTTQTLTYKTTTGVGATGADHIFQTGNNGATEAVRILNNGNVGIGTASPNQQLEITKNFRLPATTYNAGVPNGVIYKDANRFIHDFNYGNNGTVTTTGQNTFVGINSGNLTMGSTATGAYEASWNTGVGYNTLNSNTLGYGNTAIGNNALFSNTTSNENTAIGQYALYSHSTASGGNTAIGYNTLYSNISGTYNTSIGNRSLYSSTGGSNSAIGYEALTRNTTGFNNIALGFGAGKYAPSFNNNATSNNSVYLGYGTTAGANGNTNEIIIGASAVGNGSNSVTLGHTTITKTILRGNVGIGDITPDYALDVYGTICQDTNSDEVCDGSVTSDARLKTNVETIPSALEKIRQLRGVYFDWDESIDHTTFLGRGTRQIGVIAQEIEMVFPSLVYYDMNGYRMVDYQKLTGPLIEAVKELDIAVQTIPAYEDETFSSQITDFLRGIAERGEVVINIVRAKKLCAEDICIDRDQLQQMIEYMNAQGMSPAATPTVEEIVNPIEEPLVEQVEEEAVPEPLSETVESVVEESIQPETEPEPIATE